MRQWVAVAIVSLALLACATPEGDHDEPVLLAVPPIVDDTLRWLRANPPEATEIALVHGDYRLGNFLIERDGARSRLTGVLDWEKRSGQRFVRRFARCGGLLERARGARRLWLR